MNVTASLWGGKNDSGKASGLHLGKYTKLQG